MNKEEHRLWDASLRLGQKDLPVATAVAEWNAALDAYRQAVIAVLARNKEAASG